MRTAFPLLLLFTIAFYVGCNQPNTKPLQVGGNYPPVSAEQLIGESSSQRTGREKFDFVWAFERDKFTLKGKDVPPDLLALFNDGKPAASIEGVWSLKDETLTFTEIQIDGGEPKNKLVELPCFNTGVTRIQTDEAQYVF